MFKVDSENDQWFYYLNLNQMDLEMPGDPEIVVGEDSSENIIE